MKLQLPGKKTRYWQVFWLCLLAAAALFAPHCLVDAGSADYVTTGVDRAGIAKALRHFGL